MALKNTNVGKDLETNKSELLTDLSTIPSYRCFLCQTNIHQLQTDHKNREMKKHHICENCLPLYNGFLDIDKLSNHGLMNRLQLDDTTSQCFICEKNVKEMYRITNTRYICIQCSSFRFYKYEMGLKNNRFRQLDNDKIAIEHQPFVKKRRIDNSNPEKTIMKPKSKVKNIFFRKEFKPEIWTTCKTCNARFYEEELCKSHEKTCKGFICGTCDQRFMESLELSCHIYESQHQEFKCKWCGIAFISISSFTKHLDQTRENYRKYLSAGIACHVCGLVCSTMSRLVTHLENCHNKSIKCTEYVKVDILNASSMSDSSTVLQKCLPSNNLTKNCGITVDTSFRSATIPTDTTDYLLSNFSNGKYLTEELKEEANQVNHNIKVEPNDYGDNVQASYADGCIDCPQEKVLIQNKLTNLVLPESHGHKTNIHHDSKTIGESITMCPQITTEKVAQMEKHIHETGKYHNYYSMKLCGASQMPVITSNQNFKLAKSIPGNLFVNQCYISNLVEEHRTLTKPKTVLEIETLLPDDQEPDDQEPIDNHMKCFKEVNIKQENKTLTKPKTVLDILEQQIEALFPDDQEPIDKDMKCFKEVNIKQKSKDDIPKETNNQEQQHTGVTNNISGLIPTTMAEAGQDRIKQEILVGPQQSTDTLMEEQVIPQHIISVDHAIKEEPNIKSIELNLDLGEQLHSQSHIKIEKCSGESFDFTSLEKHKHSDENTCTYHVKNDESDDPLIIEQSRYSEQIYAKDMVLSLQSQILTISEMPDVLEGPNSQNSPFQPDVRIDLELNLNSIEVQTEYDC